MKLTFGLFLVVLGIATIDSHGWWQPLSVGLMVAGAVVVIYVLTAAPPLPPYDDDGSADGDAAFDAPPPLGPTPGGLRRNPEHMTLWAARTHFFFPTARHPMKSFTTADLLDAAERELAFRQRLYPRWVREGKMRQASATREIALMTAIAEHFRARMPAEPVQGEMFPVGHNDRG